MIIYRTCILIIIGLCILVASKLSSCIINNKYPKDISEFEIIDSFRIADNSNNPSFFHTYTNICHPYLTSINETGDQIFIINIESGAVYSINLKIFLKDKSIEQINNYCFVSFDSIFINGFNSNLIYHIDSGLNIKHCFEIDINLKDTLSNKTLVNSYSNPIHYWNNKLILAYQNSNYNNYFIDSIHRNRFFSDNIAFIFDLNKRNVDSLFANYPNYFKVSNDFYDWYINSCINSNKIDYVFSNIDTIYSYNMQTKISHKKGISNRFHRINSKYNHKKQNTYDDINKYYIENSFYNRIYYDSFRNRYILLYSLGTDFQKNEFENHLYSDKENLLIIHDVMNSENQYINMNAEFIPGSIAYNSKGLLVARRSKVEIKYYVYKI